MVKKGSNKRKIEIEDKRFRDDTLSTDSMEVEARKAMSAVDDVMAEFGLKTAATAGKAEMAEDKLRAARLEAELKPEAQTTADAEPGDDIELVEEPEPEGQPSELDVMKDLLLRKEAELQNFRKRVAKDKEDARRFAVEGLLYDLFPAFDGLSQAAHTFKDQGPGENPLLDGVRSTIKVMETALAKHGIEKINETDVPFDPNLHQPIEVIESAEVEGETVVEVFVEGFKLGDQVLKPAIVKVAKKA